MEAFIPAVGRGVQGATSHCFPMDHEILTNHGFMGWDELCAKFGVTLNGVNVESSIVNGDTAILPGKFKMELIRVMKLMRMSLRGLAESLNVYHTVLNAFMNFDAPTRLCGPTRYAQIQSMCAEWLRVQKGKLYGSTNDNVVMNQINLTAQQQQAVLVATYNASTGHIEYNPIRSLIYNIGEQSTVEFATGYGTNVSMEVTNNHNLYASPCYVPSKDGLTREQEFELVPANVLLYKNLIRQVNGWRFKSYAVNGVMYPDLDLSTVLPNFQLDTAAKQHAFLELFGFWLGDGTFRTKVKDTEYHYVAFVQSKLMDIEWLRHRFDVLGIVCDEQISCNENILDKRIFIVTGAVGRIWSAWFWSVYSIHYNVNAGKSVRSAKWLPGFAWCLSKNQARAVLEGARVADGAADGQHVIHTSSVVFREQLIRLAIHAGYTAVASLNQATGTSSVVQATGQVITKQYDSYRVRYTDRPQSALPAVLDTDKIEQKTTNKTWCVDVPPHHIIMARRKLVNGTHSRPVWIGNSLGQNFAKMFNIEYLNESNQKQYVYQNSWGLTTRTIGVCIMVHSDNNGLILPPAIAPIQCIIIPIIFKSGVEDIINKCKFIESQLLQLNIRVECDLRDNYNPGHKYNYHELKGVPLRIEIGPNDIKANHITVQRRDQSKSQKFTIPIDDQLPATIQQHLHSMQDDMYNKAKTDMLDRQKHVTTWSEFMLHLNNRCTVLAPHCEQNQCEQQLKKRSAIDSINTDDTLDDNDTANSNEQLEKLTGAAKSLCIPFDQPQLPSGTKCVQCDETAKNWTLFGRSY